MKVVYTEPALDELDEILAFLATHYPQLVDVVAARIREAVARLGRFPSSARLISQRSGVRVLPVMRYPYKIFYRVGSEAIEVLHIHHAAREPWPEEVSG